MTECTNGPTIGAWSAVAIVVFGVLYVITGASLPQTLRNALMFLLGKLGSQDEAPVAFTTTLRARHQRCR